MLELQLLSPLGLEWEALLHAVDCLRSTKKLTLYYTVLLPGVAATQVLNSWVFQRLRRVQEHPIVTKGQEVHSRCQGIRKLPPPLLLPFTCSILSRLMLCTGRFVFEARQSLSLLRSGLPSWCR